MLAGSSYTEKLAEKNRSNDRVILLKPIEGEKPLSSKGMVDSRLFTGENKLHCTLDSQTGLWSLKFEKGLTPGNLDQRFTTFSKAVALVKEYYRKRNVEISEIIE